MLQHKFGTHIRRLRRRRQLSQRDLAQRVRMPHNTLSQIEAGKIDPRLSQVEALSRALGTTPSALLRAAACASYKLAAAQ